MDLSDLDDKTADNMMLEDGENNFEDIDLEERHRNSTTKEIVKKANFDLNLLHIEKLLQRMERKHLLED